MKVPVVALFAVAAVAEGSVFGADPKLSHLYEGQNGEFKCADGSQVIPFDSVNDDYCDCPDGSDEPGTSACPNGHMYCANKGFRSISLSSMKVNDRVKDCCDCTDELKTPGFQCSNTCVEEGVQWRAEQAELIRAAEVGSRIRQEYVKEGRGAPAAGNLEELQLKIADLNVKVSHAQDAVEKAETAETELQRLKDTDPDYEEKARALGVEEASKGVLLDILLELTQRNGLVDSLVDVVRGFINRGVLGTRAADFLPKVLLNTKPERVETEEGKQAREIRDRLRSELDAAQRALQDAEAVAKKDFGPDKAFFKLSKNCYDMNQNQYTYTVCPFERASQSGTSLGTFSGWAKLPSGQNDYSTMLFENGQHCWGGPARSLKLEFVCGAEDKLFYVDEPEKCTYVAKFRSPAACDESVTEELKATLHDEL